MKKTTSLGHHQAGFTLIEVVLALVVSGLLMAYFLNTFGVFKKETEVAITQKRIEAVSDAIRRYTLYNRQLPCPASPTLAPEHADYGSFAPPCASIPGVTNSGNVLIGMVPTRSLNLPLDYGYDAWGSRLIYAATTALTLRPTYNPANAAVSVDGANVPYVVVSVGRNKEGGRTRQTNAGPAIPCGFTASVEDENCNDDHIFTFRGQSLAAGGTYYDDYLSFKNLPVHRNTAFPPGAIVPFRLTACPNTWQPFTQANGRAIIGRTPPGFGNYTQNSPTIANNLAASYLGETYGFATTGGFATRLDHPTLGANQYFNMPPYKSYIYCEKE